MQATYSLAYQDKNHSKVQTQTTDDVLDDVTNEQLAVACGE
jgi:hypothetical protein